MTASNPKMSLVLVGWVDSNHINGWRSIDDMRESAMDGGLLCESVGYLFVSGEDRIVLVQSVSDTGMVDAAMTIPRAAVVKFETIRQEGGDE